MNIDVRKLKPGDRVIEFYYPQFVFTVENISLDKDPIGDDWYLINFVENFPGLKSKHFSYVKIDDDWSIKNMFKLVCSINNKRVINT